MPGPRREDYDTVIKDMQRRLTRLERGRTLGLTGADQLDLLAKSLGPQIVGFYDTGAGSERTSSIVLSSAQSTANRTPIYSFQIAGLLVSDIIIAWAETQISNTIDHIDNLPGASSNSDDGELNVEVSHQLVMTSDSPAAWVPSVNPITATALSQSNGLIITPRGRLSELRNIGAVSVTDPTRNRVHLLAYASHAAVQAGDALGVTASRGRLTILHLRPRA